MQASSNIKSVIMLMVDKKVMITYTISPMRATETIMIDNIILKFSVMTIFYQ